MVSNQSYAIYDWPCFAFNTTISAITISFMASYFVTAAALSIRNDVLIRSNCFPIFNWRATKFRFLIFGDIIQVTSWLSKNYLDCVMWVCESNDSSLNNLKFHAIRWRMKISLCEEYPDWGKMANIIYYWYTYIMIYTQLDVAPTASEMEEFRKEICLAKDQPQERSLEITNSVPVQI